MKHQYSIDVHARWSVSFLATPAQVADMRADGLVQRRNRQNAAHSQL